MAVGAVGAVRAVDPAVGGNAAKMVSEEASAVLSTSVTMPACDVAVLGPGWFDAGCTPPLDCSALRNRVYRLVEGGGGRA